MPEVLQTLSPSFTPPPAAAAWPVTDKAKAKAKVIGYPLAPATGAPVIASFQLNRALSGAALAKLLTLPTNPLNAVVPTTQTGHVAYRQCPNVGLARNLVPNGGFQSGSHGWTLPANASVVVDATSPTGYALRTIATAADQRTIEDIPVEAGKAYSLATQIRGDGTAGGILYITWIDGGGNFLANVNTATFTGLAYAEAAIVNTVAPGNARTMRVILYMSAAGIIHFTAVRVMQQAGAPAAWIAAHQQYVSRGLSIYDAHTNILADPDMEAVGTASWAATAATLTKDTVTFFAGAKSLKVVTTAATGYAAQSGALAAGQAITASVRHKQGTGTNGGIGLFSTPSFTNIGAGTDLATDADWTVRRVSGVIKAGDTGWQMQLQGGAGIGDTSYFDNAAVENWAFDTMNADPSGQAFAVAARTASSNVLPLPTGLDIADFSRVIAVRFDHPYNGPTSDRFLWTLWVDANNYISLRSRGATQVIVLSKVRAGVLSEATDATATAFVAGDTLSIGFRYSASVGLELQISKNGGAVATYTNTSAESKLPIAGTPTNYLGRFGLVGYEMDGTVGIDRLMKAGLTAATLSARVLDPYGDPDDNDLVAPWSFEGQTVQLPVWDDEAVKLATAHDYRVDTSSTSPNAATAVGQLTRATVPAERDAFWLKDITTPTNNLKLPVRYDAGIPFSRPRRAQTLEPLAGSTKTVNYGAVPYGDDITLTCIFATASELSTVEATLKRLLAVDGAIYYQDRRGGLYKVRFPAGLAFTYQDYEALEAEIRLTEVT
jgi:hypothetical protein